MGVHAYLCGVSPSEYRTIESPVPYRVKAVGDDRVDVGCAREETINAHDACRDLMVFVPDEGSLLQLHGDGFYILARVQRSDRQCIGTQGLTFGRYNKEDGVKLREHSLHEHPETVHHGQYAYHSRCDYRHRSGTDAGYDIDGVVPFL